jgi:hypothetical protein
MNSLVRTLVWVGLSCVVGCGGTTEDGPFKVDREIDLDLEQGSGFDHWGTPGAALGYTLDLEKRLMLVVALKFQLPVYTVTLSPPSNGSATLSDYEVRSPNSVLADDVQQYPLLGIAITDTNGIRALSGTKTVAAFLLEGDFQQSTPERAWVAVRGELTLTREEDYFDYLEGALQFQEIENLGGSAHLLSGGGETVGLNSFAFDWNTAVQP